jgi:arylsulfatase A-like enzyme
MGSIMLSPQTIKYKIIICGLIGLAFGLLSAIAEGIWQTYYNSKIYFLSIGINVLFYGLAAILFCLVFIIFSKFIKVLKDHLLSFFFSFLLSLCGFILSLIYVYPHVITLNFMHVNPFSAVIMITSIFILVFFIVTVVLVKIKLKILFLYFFILLYIAFLFIGILRQQLNRSNTTFSRKVASDDYINIIFIVNDSLRSDHLSCYGYNKNTSPYLDAFAKKGLLFTRAITQGANTSIATPSLLNSRYPYESYQSLINGDFPGLAEVLQHHGYITAAFSANPFISAEFGFNRGYDLFIYLPHADRFDILLLNLYSKITPYLNIPSDGGAFYAPLSNINLRIKDFLVNNQNKPFFIYIHTMDTHIPYLPPSKYVKKFLDNYKKDYANDYYLQRMNKMEQSGPHWDKLLNNLIARYDASILFLDEHIGELWAYIEKLHLQDKTLLIITADHGDEHKEHGKLFHGHNLYEETIHVPLIFYHSNALPQGKVITQLVGHIDIMPTILDMLNLSVDKEMKGLSLLPIIRDQSQPLSRDFILSQANDKVAIMNDKWKCIANLDDSQNIKGVEFYDLVNDPRELHNLAQEEIDIKEIIHAKLLDYLKHAKSRKLEMKIDNITPELRKRLKALGYIN